ncbi:MAG: hypothetical protein JXB04_01950 [Kiritimatiellae bacterium]|nr:hypothetical protein [Kiritimatiellia bacterium]
MRQRANEKRWVHGVLLFLLLAAAVELLSRGAGVFLAGRGILYRPRPLPEEAYGEYLAARHPVLGWSPGEGPRTAGDERPGALSVYGDSFTWCSGVGDSAAWPAVLSDLIGRRVDNYGVGGYGTDQACLRFLLNAGDAAGVVMLVHTSENILRNVNQLQDLLYPGEGVGFKPRFATASDGSLMLVPLPAFPFEDYVRAVRHPERQLAHEYFAPGGAAGVVRLRFPYTVSVLRALRHFHVRARLEGAPWYADFYRRDHPSGALEVTAGILRLFCREARSRGRVPVIAVMPTGLDLVYFRRNGAWVHPPLLDELAGDGERVLDLGPRLLDEAGASGIENLFDDVSSHYNAEGCRAIAGCVRACLAETGLVPEEKVP